MSKQKKHQQSSLLSPKRILQIELIGLLAIIGLMIYHAVKFEFVQDDSFITFRYVKNFIAGHGLVFNIGEKVEGYTTFLWTILLAILGKLGFELISLSQILGVLFGVGTMYITYQLSRNIAGTERTVGFSLIAVLLFASNSAVAYWLVSGMETGMFVFLTVVSVWLYLKERNSPKSFAYAPIAFVLLSLTRPEGMYLFGLTMMHFIAEKFLTKGIDKKVELKRLITWCALYAVPIGLFMGWRLSYYGWMFPNTYYAKAGFSKDYFFAGVDYFWEFARLDLLWGALLFVPIIFLLWKKRNWDMMYLIFIILAYSSYVVSVGGDVLANFRFFIPMLPLMYILVQETFYELYAMARENQSSMKNLVYVAPLVVAYFTFSIPYDHVREKCDLEIGLVSKMTQQGLWFKTHSKPDAVIAATTIGAVSYYSDLMLIDMLGLTDETIAHNPEKLEGIESGWKERHHNSAYVLSRKPDWILFSTASKPSAYAERALFTKKEFRQWYYPYYFHPDGDAQVVGIVYKRGDQAYTNPALVETHPVQNQFINNYVDGVNRIYRYTKDAMPYFKKCEAEAPADFGMLYEAMAQTAARMNNTELALAYYAKALEIDPRLVESNQMLGSYALQKGDLQKALPYLEQAVRINPEYSSTWMLYGVALAGLGDLPRAQSALEQALQLAPNNADAYTYLQRITGKG